MTAGNFDAKAYKEVIKKAGSGVLADSIKQVRQDLDRDPSSESFYKLDLPYLFGVPENPASADLSAWLNSLQASLNKSARKNRPGAMNLQMLLGTLTDHPSVKLEDPQFWARFVGRHEQTDTEQLISLLRRIGRRSELGAVTKEQLIQELENSDYADVSPSTLSKAIEDSGLRVVETVELEETRLPVALRQLWEKLSTHVHYRTFVHAIRFHAGSEVSKIRIFGTFSANGMPITHAELEKSLQRAQKENSSPEVEALKKFLSRLQSDATNADDLARFTIASLAESVNNNFKNGLDAEQIFRRLVDDGLQVGDAMQLVLALSDSSLGGAPLSAADAIDSALAAGELAKAEQLVSTFEGKKVEGEEYEQFLEAKARTEDAKSQKAELLEAYKKALTEKDYSQAERALMSAKAIDSEDPELQDLLADLPPQEVAQVSAANSPSGDVQIHWSESATPGVTYTVFRRASGSSDWSAVARNIRQTSLEDSHPLIGQLVEYGVTASRSTGLQSTMTTSAAVAIAPPPRNVTAAADRSSLTISWDRPREATSTVISVVGPNAFTYSEEVLTGNVCSVRNLSIGVTYSISVVSVYKGSGRELQSDPLEVRATPRAEAAPPEAIKYEIQTTSGGNEVLSVAWNTVPGYSSQLWSFPQGVAINYGTCLPERRVEEKGGVQLKPRSAEHEKGYTNGGQFDAPVEPIQVIPALETEQGLLFGEPTFVGVAKEVELAQATLLGEDVQISFKWPAGNVEVDIVWSDEGIEERKIVTRAQYKRNGGVFLPHAHSISDITATTVLDIGGDLIRSKPVKIAYTPPLVKREITYQLENRKGVFGGKITTRITAHSPMPNNVVEAVLTLKNGSIMPLDVHDGARQTPIVLNFDENGQATAEVSLGKVRSPYWTKLFSVDPNIVLIDPPTTHLKG
ncbi:fibronectin type III domain-containing protein [Corynebacterium glucuronolyticum]|uniref:Fibronectin type III domain-containing protein n=2 Tax=Corynebacterium glucuronolyticum TaxID=39791 RepID=A0AAX1L824_9CORY|nr:fibronectin type III domain-containing protein [Corynebacterium glucuronolyticum]EEI61888.1 putative bacteriochlorophyll 4-vinyl reductase [Corynebacterium glucuronolyticum ATCC 51866]QRP70566.1 fibronectin type III domain-containing protein [Corynebacterium glucuronolyticum]